MNLNLNMTPLVTDDDWSANGMDADEYTNIYPERLMEIA